MRFKIIQQPCPTRYTVLPFKGWIYLLFGFPPPISATNSAIFADDSFIVSV